MPTLKMGAKASFEQGGVFVQLKAKNEQILFTVVGDPVYTGKHFSKVNNSWDIAECPRIMTEEHCETCEKYFEAIAPLKELKKKMKDIQGDSKEAKLEKAKIQVEINEVSDKARPWKATIGFFYPIIDRVSHKAKIYQTTLSTRLNLDKEIQAGIDVKQFTYKVTRTEERGPNYYSFVRMPDKEVFTEEELKEVEKAKAFDLSVMVSGKKSEQLEELPKMVEEKVVEPTDEENKEQVNPDDIPF